MERVIWSNEIAKRTVQILVNTESYLINFDRPKSEWTKLPNGSIIPCYCNCRYLNSYPGERKTIVDYFCSTVKENFPDSDLVVGLATAGISWATLLSDRLNLPLSYVRSNGKDYGVGKLVEGRPRRGQNAIIIDDALFTGESSVKAIKALTEEYDIKVAGLVAIIALSHWEGDNFWNALRDKGVGIRTLTDYQTVLELLVNRNRLTQNQRSILEKYYDSPSSYQYE